MEKIGDRIMEMVKSGIPSKNTEQKSNYNCPICKDDGFTIYTDDKGMTHMTECVCNLKEKARRMWHNFGVDPDKIKKLNEYKPYDDTTTKARDKAVQYIKDYDSICNTPENSFGLFGQPGAGKSHIILSIGAALLNRDNPVWAVYMPYLEVMKSLKANTMDEEYYMSIARKYLNAKLLIIDDLFKDKVRNGQLMKDRNGEACLNEADMKHIMPIINHRYLNNLPMVISTECTPKMLLELDGALARRIIERCGDNIVVFDNKKYNYSMRKFQEKE